MWFLHENEKFFWPKIHENEKSLVEKTICKIILNVGD